MKTQDKIEAMVLGGLADDEEDALAMLIDMGEVDEDEEVDDGVHV